MTLLVFVFSTFACSGCAVISTQTVDLVGQPVPSSRLMLLDGSQIPLQPDPGRTAAVLFWATWCPHSRSVVEEYEHLARRHASQPDVDFFAVSIDKNEHFEILKSRIQSQDLRTITHCFSGNDVEDEAFYSVKGKTVPFMMVIDSRGIVRVVTSDVDEVHNYLMSVRS